MQCCTRGRNFSQVIKMFYTAHILGTRKVQLKTKKEGKSTVLINQHFCRFLSRMQFHKKKVMLGCQKYATVPHDSKMAFWPMQLHNCQLPNKYYRTPFHHLMC